MAELRAVDLVSAARQDIPNKCVHPVARFEVRHRKVAGQDHALIAADA